MKKVDMNQHKQSAVDKSLFRDSRLSPKFLAVQFHSDIHNEYQTCIKVKKKPKNKFKKIK